MMRKFILFLVLICSSLYGMAQEFDMIEARLKHLPVDAKASNTTQFLTLLMESEENPLNYLPIIGTMDSISSLMKPYTNISIQKFDKFIDDLHTLQLAVEILKAPYDGGKIKEVSELIPNLSFYTSEQKNDKNVDSIFNAVTQYYGITTNMQELLEEVIGGYNKYLTSSSDEEKEEIVSEIIDGLTFDARNQRISRIPYLKEQLLVVFNSCNFNEDKRVEPDKFDIETLKMLYDINEKARASRPEASTKGNNKKGKLNNK